tara:strand:+ start:10367 stop:12385 length:2019 start_codon:yes stop_codon:yes gene_type:complete
MALAQPLPVKNPLAGNPKTAPKYHVDVKLGSGTTLPLSDPKAIRAMIALMDMQAVLGGAASHWGGPSALTELWSALHGLAFSEAVEQGVEWHERFHLVNDAGHCENALYAIKANYGFADLTVDSLKGFRSIKSQLTGHGESHLFPEGVYVSNGPLGSSIGPAQGLCFADALSGKMDRVTVTTISDGACMEGEAKEALAAIPGLAAKGKMAPFVLIISDNNTKLSGRIDDQSYSMAPSFESLSTLGWNVISLEDGNDLEKTALALEQAFKESRSNPHRPMAIHAKTVKGFGVEATAQSSSGGHGFPLKTPADLPAFLEEIYSGEAIPSELVDWGQVMIKASEKPKGASAVKKMKVQEGVAEALIEKAQQGLPVYNISSDLPGSTGTGGFQKGQPDNCYDIGVAESNMVSMAAGLSKQGYIPVVDTFAQFGATKGALPLTMASLSQAPMICIFSHAGFQDAADGASHQALTYISMLSAIPEVNVYCLSTKAEAKALVSQAIDEFAEARKQGKVPKTSVFYLGRETFVESLGESLTYELGKAQVVADTSDQFEKSVTLLAAGPLVHQAVEAVTKLADKNIGAIVVNASCVNDPDVATLKKSVEKTKKLITIEDHQIVGGLGAIASHSLLQAGLQFQCRSLGVSHEFGQSAYKASELYSKHNLDADSIVKTMEQWT